MGSLQEIIELHGTDYVKSESCRFNISNALFSIKSCRTAALGGHVYECDTCGEIKISYNSCRNRHCPKCQTFAKEKWIYERSKSLLPTHYFHMVFTVPEQLNSLILFNQKEMYSIFFASVSETLIELAKDKKYLNADIGFTSYTSYMGSKFNESSTYSLHSSRWWLKFRWA